VLAAKLRTGAPNAPVVSTAVAPRKTFRLVIIAFSPRDTFSQRANA
jgi:hypothetical protein